MDFSQQTIANQNDLIFVLLSLTKIYQKSGSVFFIIPETGAKAPLFCNPEHYIRQVSKPSAVILERDVSVRVGNLVLEFEI